MSRLEVKNILIVDILVVLGNDEVKSFFALGKILFGHLFHIGEDHDLSFFAKTGSQYLGVVCEVVERVHDVGVVLFVVHVDDRQDYVSHQIDSPETVAQEKHGGCLVFRVDLQEDVRVIGCGLKAVQTDHGATECNETVGKVVWHVLVVRNVLLKEGTEEKDIGYSREY